MGDAPESFQDRLQRFVRQPECARVFDEAKRLAKDPAAKDRIEQVYSRVISSARSASSTTPSPKNLR